MAKSKGRSSGLPNLDKLSVAQLNDVIQRAEKLIGAKKDEAKNEFMARMRAEAAASGLSLDEIMGRGPGGRRKRSDAGVKLKPKYVGPNGETYTGRGPTPRWLKALEAKGHNRDRYLT